MLGSKKREPERYYLLPGMARGNRERHMQWFRRAVVIGLVAAGLLSALIYHLHTRRPF